MIFLKDTVPKTLYRGVLERTFTPGPNVRSNTDDAQRRSAAVPSGDDSTLRGFLPADKRIRMSAFFVSGIMINNTVDITLQCVTKYLTDKDVHVKTSRVLRETGNTMSLKLVIKEEHENMIIDNTFWPEGIQCRKWRN